MRLDAVPDGWYPAFAMKLLVAKPRGFCAGVDRAIDILEMALDLYGPPVYMRHEIVHNKIVVARLVEKGAIFVERTDEIPEGAVTVFSAHGISPKVRDEAKARKLRMIDATCPLVTKVHLEAIRFSRDGYHIIIIGHRGHVEMEGTMGEVPAGQIQLIETKDEVAGLVIPDGAKVALLTQTTLSVDDTTETIAAVQARFPDVLQPPKEDICYATTNRQAAVKVMAPQCDVVFVIGSVTSSNSNRLREVAEKYGARAYLIDRAADIQEEWMEGAYTIGLTSGASAPDDLIEEAITYFKAKGVGEVEEIVPLREDVYFALPPDIVREAKESGKAGKILAKHHIAADTKMRTK